MNTHTETLASTPICAFKYIQPYTWDRCVNKSSTDLTCIRHGFDPNVRKIKKGILFCFVNLEQISTIKTTSFFVPTSKLTNRRIQVFDLMLSFPVLSSSLHIRILQPSGEVRRKKKKKAQRADKTGQLPELCLKLQLTLKWMPFLANKYRSHWNCCFNSP